MAAKHKDSECMKFETGSFSCYPHQTKGLTINFLQPVCSLNMLIGYTTRPLARHLGGSSLTTGEEGVQRSGLLI